ncbi:hypothetical protein [Actinoplanes sp. NPDC020271]|uniref:hypothetical protein n=1 Tax=Actinoplanes sp. NPDC020271 TaxID=3363896 RepID=UPI0037B0E6A7
MTDAWASLFELSQQLTVRLLIVLAVGLLVGLGSLSAAMTGGWLSLGADLAVNVAASAVVAGTAVAGFLLSTRRRALRRMLALRRADLAAAGERNADLRSHQHAQAVAIAAQIRDRRSQGVVLVEAAPDGSRGAFLQGLSAVMADRQMVGVIVGEDDLQGQSLVEAVTGAVRRTVQAAGVEDAPLGRTVEDLAGRRQVVALIEGLDGPDQPVSMQFSGSSMADRLETLTLTGIPIVALLEPGSTPSKWHHIRVRLPMAGPEAVLTFAGLPPHLPPDWVAARARLGAARRLAGSLQLRGLDIRTVGDAVRVRRQERNDTIAATTLDQVGTELSDNGPTAFATQRLWDIGFLRTPSRSLRRKQSPAAAALERLGRHLLTYERKQVALAVLLAENGAEVSKMITGLAELEHLVIVERIHQGGEVLIRFAEPLVREFVVGVCVVRARLPFAHAARRGSPALVGEVVGRMLDSHRRDRTWQNVLEQTANDGLLTCASEAASVLSRLTAMMRPDLPAAWLAKAWDAADDRERATFVRRLPARIHDDHVRYLWRRLVPPLFVRTPHQVRRTIARHLGAAGDQAWDCLGSDWRKLIEHGRDGGLAWHQRHTSTWKAYGSALASLGWLLPAVALTSGSPEACRLLERLTGLAVPGGGPETTPEPDIGIEISLAEGTKDMAYLALVRDEPLPDVLVRQLLVLISESRSWVSQILGLQALVLAAAVENVLIGAVVSCCRTVGRRSAHPLILRYIDLVLRTLDEPDLRLNNVVHRIVWPDDTEALAGAGGNLAPEALEVLASATIVLNLVEARIRRGGDRISAQTARVKALVENDVPGCLSSPLLARAFGRAPCACGLGLCDGVRGGAVRPMSSAFAYRCLCDEDVTKAAGYRQGRALTLHLERIARHEYG